MSTPRKFFSLYFIAAFGMLIVLIMNLRSGADLPRLAGSAALLGVFTLLGLFPDATARPRWVIWVTLILMALALGLQLLRLGGRLG